VAKVDQQSNLGAGCGQVVEHLRTVFVGQGGDRLNLHNHLIEAEKVGDEALCQRVPLVGQGKLFLSIEPNVLHPQFDLKAFLVNRLRETASLLVVDLKAGTDQAVGLLLQRIV